jgi:hypothetical protein
MSPTLRALAYAFLMLAALAAAGCVEDGIGMGVPTTGARWGDGGPGPPVFVAGGPVYR